MTSILSSRLGAAPEEGIKAPVAVVSSDNITLSGVQTIEGVSTSDGVRVLVNGQTDSSDNGIYVASSSSWSRSGDWNGNDDVSLGQLVVDSNTGAIYKTVFTGTFSMDSTEVTFETFQTGRLKVKEITDTAYTLLVEDLGYLLAVDTATTCVISVPTGLGEGFNCEAIQMGAGQIVVSAPNLNKLSAGSKYATRVQNSPMSIQFIDATNFVLGGDLDDEILSEEQLAILSFQEEIGYFDDGSEISGEPDTWYAWKIENADINTMTTITGISGMTDFSIAMYQRVGGVDTLVSGTFREGLSWPSGLIDIWTFDDNVEAVFVLAKNDTVSALNILLKVI